MLEHMTTVAMHINLSIVTHLFAYSQEVHSIEEQCSFLQSLLLEVHSLFTEMQRFVTCVIDLSIGLCSNGA